MNGPRLHSTAAANVLLALSMGGVAFVAARLLGPAGFGDYSLALTLTSLTVLVLSAGTGVALKLQLDTSGGSVIRPYLSFSLMVSAVSFLVLIPLTLVFGQSWPFAMAVGVLGFSSMLARQAIDGFHAQGLSEKAIVLAAAGALTGLAALLALNGLGLLSANAAVWVTAIASTIPVYPYVRHIVRLRAQQGLGAAGWAPIAQLIRVGLPSLGNSAGLVVLQRVDRIFVALFAGPAALGVYSVAVGVGEIARLAPMSIGQVAFFRASRGDLAAERRLRVFALAAAATLGVVTIVLAPVLVPWAFGPEYSEAVLPLQILAVGEIVFTLSFVDSRLLLGKGRVREVGLLSAVVAIVGTLLYAIAIARFGVTGAAWASVASYTLLSVVLAVAYHRFRAVAVEGQPT